MYLGFIFFTLPHASATIRVCHTGRNMGAEAYGKAHRTIKRTQGQKRQTTQRPHSYDFPDGGNLYLQVSNSTPDKKNRVHVNTSWTFKYELRGRRREMGLGPTHTRSLK